MLDQPGLQSLIWAVDPFEFQSLPRREIFAQAIAYIDNATEKIWPAFVCGPDQLENWKEDEDVQKTLSFLKELGLHDLVLIPSDSNSRKDQVEELLNYAKRKQADVVLLTAHGHSAFSHFFVGSFAKEILTKADLPLLFLTAHQPRNIVPSRKALFVSDFSEHSKNVYQFFLKKFGPILEEVIIYYAVSLPITALSASAYSGIPASLSDAEIKGDIDRAKKLCGDFCAQGQGIHSKIKFRTRIEPSVESIGQMIADAATEENAGIVALASHALSIEERLLGSQTEDIFEKVNCPVWVCGPEFQIPISASSREISPIV